MPAPRLRRRPGRPYGGGGGGAAAHERPGAETGPRFWSDGTVFFLSERDRAGNLWPYDPETGELRQRTFHAAFEGTAGRQTVITVNDRPTPEGAREVTVVPVRSENALRTRGWIDANRRKVDELSDGRLAYVYLPNTSQAGYDHFNRYYFAQQDREGAVIDERDNGGGFAVDYMVDVMARELQGYFNSPVGDRKPFTQPIAGIFGPKVMVINEMAGSGGDLLPYLFRQRGLGPLVGTRTWGGLVRIWDSPQLADGGVMLAPRGGFFDLEGRWAVENEGVELLEEPDPPVRWERPEGREPPGG